MKGTSDMTVTREESKVRSSELAEKVKKLIHEGNVRRIIVKDSHGHTVMEVPVTVGVGAFILAPVITAVSALAALSAEWNIQIDRTDDGVTGSENEIIGGP
jgi:acid phosphatase family membrane protein YuiD